MRSAHTCVMPGSFSSSASLARLMSRRWLSGTFTCSGALAVCEDVEAPHARHTSNTALESLLRNMIRKGADSIDGDRDMVAAMQREVIWGNNSCARQ